MIDRATVDRITAAADIVEVVGDFITLKKKGTNYTACCPFHNEKTPSFMVSPAKGLYKCFGCGKGGGAVSFVMEHEKLSYPEALKWLARKYGIEVKEKELTTEELERNNDRESMLVVNSFADKYFQNQLHKTIEGRDVGLSYFKERGFTPTTIEKFSLGYCPASGDAMSRKGVEDGYEERFLVATGLTILRENSTRKYYDRFCGRVIFPIHSLTGRVIGFGGRTMSTDKKTAKYLNSPQSEVYDKSHTLYGIFQAKKAITQGDKCILVEGYTDVMQMHQSGIENVVASSGTSLTVQQIKLIKRFTKNVTVIYDGDYAGIKASLRGIDMLLAEGLTVRVVPLPEGEDPDSFAAKHSATELESYIERNEEDFLRFKTRILLKDAAGDPAARAALVADIVGSLAVIEDNITREVYIKECARELDVNYDILSREVVTRMIAMPNPQAIPVINQQPVTITPQKPTIIKRDSAVEVLEREIISYLVRFGDQSFEYELSEDNIVMMPVAGTIINELKNDNIHFTVPVLQEILGYFTEAIEGGEQLSGETLLSSNNREVASTVADMMMWEDANPASKFWDNNDMRPKSEKELLYRSVPKAILLYKSKVLEMQILALKAEFAENNSDFNRETVEKIQELSVLRNSILERYSRLL
ncbi:MAG: DNA primase [Rikenellaceae bacterium]